jgi:hypothetical protein
MLTLTLTREPSLPSGEGTFGRLVLPLGVIVHTLELEWRGNQHGVSCIPCRRYELHWDVDAHFPRGAYFFRDAETLPRTGIRMHCGNFAGDESQGWQTDVAGCLLVGLERGGVLNKHRRLQAGVMRSRDALERIASELNYQPFLLQIEGYP